MRSRCSSPGTSAMFNLLYVVSRLIKSVCLVGIRTRLVGPFSHSSSSTTCSRQQLNTCWPPDRPNSSSTCSQAYLHHKNKATPAPCVNRAVCCVCRKEQKRRGSLELLESEKQMCNLISKYSPEYVRSRALESPKDAFAVLVSRIKPQHTQLSAQPASLLTLPCG